MSAVLTQRPCLIRRRCLFRATRRSGSAGASQTARSVAGAELLGSITKEAKSSTDGSNPTAICVVCLPTVCLLHFG